MNKICQSDLNHPNDFEWSFLGDTDERERMCRSLDFETVTNSNLGSSMAMVYADRSEPLLLEKIKGHDGQGIFGSQRIKDLWDLSKTKESFKDKLLSVWTNTKNGFMAKLTQDFKETPEIWMLGTCYKNDVSGFKKDFYKLPWITYRRGFPELGTQRMTSDVGWGCMIRCAQMCLAVTLNSHWKSRKREACRNFNTRVLLKLFGDKLHPDCPFSIHSLVGYGETRGRLAGSWFGPASISVALREALIEHQATHQTLNDLAIYIAQDSTVFIRDALEVMSRGQKSLMITVPLRLGFQHANEVYMESFKRVFEWRFCVGVLGGRPKHSLLFIGYQDNDLIYLDPHFNQDAVDLSSSDSLESYHCATPMKLNISKMDPTCAVAFYCSDVTDFWELIKLVRQMEDDLKKMRSVPKQIPMLHFVDARHVDFLDPDHDVTDDVEAITDESVQDDSSMEIFSVEEDDMCKRVISERCSKNCRNQDRSRRGCSGHSLSPRLDPSLANFYRVGGPDDPGSSIDENSVTSYSMLDDAGPIGEDDSTADDFSHLSIPHGSALCKPSCAPSSRRRFEWLEEGKHREEDGFVVI